MSSVTLPHCQLSRADAVLSYYSWKTSCLDSTLSSSEVAPDPNLLAGQQLRVAVSAAVSLTVVKAVAVAGQTGWMSWRWGLMIVPLGSLEQYPDSS